MTSDNIILLMDETVSGSLRGFVVQSTTQSWMDTPVVIPNLKQWYYVAFTLSGNVGSIYVNAGFECYIEYN